jgi:hypothetical protein
MCGLDELVIESQHSEGGAVDCLVPLEKDGSVVRAGDKWRLTGDGGL